MVSVQITPPYTVHVGVMLTVKTFYVFPDVCKIFSSYLSKKIGELFGILVFWQFHHKYFKHGD
jgi:hypothetical protein